MSLITIIPTAGRAEPDNLTAADYEACLENVERVLSLTQAPAAVFGIEASFNEDKDNPALNHCQVHAHGLCGNWYSDEQAETLRRVVALTTHAPRALLIEKFDDQESGRAYPYKPDRVRRVSYVDDSNPCRAPHQNTRDRDLRVLQQVELAKAEHAFGLSRRLLIHGIPAVTVNRALVGFEWLADSL